MKKYLLSIVAFAFACFGVANAGVSVTAVNIPQPANDTMMFALPVDVNVYQDIQNYPDADPGSRMMKFQPEYLVTAQDFTKGDITKGTATLPANAKVIGLGLDGYDVATDNASTQGIYLDVTAWCRNIPVDQLEMDNFDELLEGYKTNKPKGDLFVDTIAHPGARFIPSFPGFHCVFDPNATAQNPGSIVDIPFDNPDSRGLFTPFWYKGENIYLTLWMSNCEDIHMKYRYMAFDDAEAETASLMRSGAFCFSDATYEYIAEYFGVQLMYDLPKHRLPAFRTPYFTNDIRITVEGRPAFIELQDEDGNVMTPGDDDNYYCLDHTKQYILYVDSNEGVEIAFDDIYSDIEVIVKKEGTAVEEVNATKTVSNVAYYNLAGQQSAQPVSGVNIVVTTYSDGSTTTAKVIR